MDDDTKAVLKYVAATMGWYMGTWIVGAYLGRMARKRWLQP